MRVLRAGLIRLLRGYFGFGGFFFHRLFVLVIDGGLEDDAATAAAAGHMNERRLMRCDMGLPLPDAPSTASGMRQAWAIRWVRECSESRNMQSYAPA